MNKRDLSVSMNRANVFVLFVAIPFVGLLYFLFEWRHPTPDNTREWSFFFLLFLLILGVFVHELIHGIAWALAGRKPWSSIKFGFQVKTLTPYCHITEPLEVNAYRIGTLMPGLLLGILVYLYSWMSGDTNWFWFSLVNMAAAGGDWLVLWLIRNVRTGSLVEDHPTNAGCFVYEP
jgi:hypothetical protein